MGPTRRSTDRPRTGHRPLRLAPVAVLALVLAATGCGGGSDSSDGDAVSLASWKKQVNQLCAAARKDVDGIPVPEGADDFATWASSGVAVKRRVNTFIDDVDRIGTPDPRSATAAKFMDTWRAYTADFDAVVAAAKQEDQAKVEAATTALQDANDSKDQLAESLGLTECFKSDTSDHAADDASDTTGDTPSEDPTTTTTTAPDGTGDLPPSEWSAQIDAACSRLGDKYSGLGQADPQTLEEAQRVADDLGAFATELVAEWDRIGPPAGDTTEATQLYDLFVRFEDVAARFRAAVGDGDTAAISSVSAELDQVLAEMDPLASRLGVPSCGSS